MFHNEKIKKVLAVGVGVLGGLVLVAVLFFLTPQSSQENVDSVSHRKAMPSVIDEKVDNRQAEEHKGIDFQRITDVFRPVTQIFQMVAITPDDGNAKEEQAPLQDDFSQSSSFTPQSLSEEEIFEWTWGSDYRIQLAAIGTVMESDSFLQAGEKLVSGETNEDMYYALKKLFEYALLKGWVSASDAEKLKIGLDGLPAMIALEQDALRRGENPKAVLPGHQSFRSTKSTVEELVADLIDGIKYAFSTPEAQAQLGGSWVTSPDCYKDLNPLNITPGPDLWSFCCNCGCRWVGYVCVYVDDCGPYSVGCDIPFGCLNLMCGAWPNAIWDRFDYPLGTGICGCG